MIDPSASLFVHVTAADLLESPPPRFRTYYRDCLRAAIGNGRASLGGGSESARVVNVVFFAEQDHEQDHDASDAERTLALVRSRFEGVSDVLAAETTNVRIFFGRATRRFCQLEMGEMCHLGGVASPSCPGIAADALEGGSGRGQLYTPKAPTMHLHQTHCKARTWSREGDMLSDPALDIADLDRARANMADCPPVLWINLERHDGRRRHMESFLEALRVPWHRRVAAIDAKEASSFFRRVVRAPAPGVEDRVHACAASHMVAISRFVEEFPDAPYAIVMEDDVCFEAVEHWPRTIGGYVGDAFVGDDDVAGGGVVQLSGVVFYEGQTDPIRIDRMRASLPPPGSTSRLSCAAYAITIERARELVEKHVIRSASDDGLHRVDLTGAVSPHAEEIMYGSASTPFLPIFPTLGTDSDLYAVNPACHSFVRGFLTRFWRETDESKECATRGV